MENICHTLLGAALSKAGLERETALATPTLLIAANLPDIDIAGTAFGRNYLDFHRGITHALVGVGAASVVLAAAVWGVDRIVFVSRQTRARFYPLWYLSLAGLLTHPFLDYLNDYGIRPWLPFSNRWQYGDLLSIVDPWLWIIFGAALFTVSRSRAGRLAWTALAAFLGALVFWGGGPRTGVIWLGALALALGTARFFRRNGFEPARVALGAFAVYLAATAGLHWHVLRSARSIAASFSEPVRGVHVLPARSGSGYRWVAVVETDNRYYFAEAAIFGFSQPRPRFESFEKNLDDPCYRAALSQEQMAVMARFARFPSVSSHASGGSCTVVLRDLRYARQALGGWGTARATIRAPENP